MLGDRLKKLRSSKNLTQTELAKLIGITRGTYAHYEINKRQPDYEILEKIADFYDVSMDYLLGRSEVKTNVLPELNEKDEKDIQKKLEEMIENLTNKDGYAAFDGKNLDENQEEDIEILKASLENSLRLAKRIAKQKFTPKKYRK